MVQTLYQGGHAPIQDRQYDHVGFHKTWFVLAIDTSADVFDGFFVFSASR